MIHLMGGLVMFEYLLCRLVLSKNFFVHILCDLVNFQVLGLTYLKDRLLVFKCSTDNYSKIYGDNSNNFLFEFILLFIYFDTLL